MCQGWVAEAPAVIFEPLWTPHLAIAGLVTLWGRTGCPPAPPWGVRWWGRVAEGRFQERPQQRLLVEIRVQSPCWRLRDGWRAVGVRTEAAGAPLAVIHGGGGGLQYPFQAHAPTPSPVMQMGLAPKLVEYCCCRSAGARALGRIVMRLDWETMPKTAASFCALCDGALGPRHHFKDRWFSRIFPKVAVQGVPGVASIYGTQFADEGFALKHDRAGVRCGRPGIPVDA